MNKQDSNNQEQVYLGRLGKDPDLRYTMNNKAICFLSVAINNNKDEKPEWKKVVVWGKQAEVCPLYLKKGQEVFIQGRPQVKEFVNGTGVKKQYEEISAKLVGFPNV